MMRHHTLRQISLCALSFILALCVLSVGTAGFGAAFAEEVVWVEDGSPDDAEVWEGDGIWEDDEPLDDGAWDDTEPSEDDGSWDDAEPSEDDGSWDDAESWEDDGSWDDAEPWVDDNTAYDYDYYDVSVEGGIGVFDASNGIYLREEDASDPELDEDEFRSFYVNVRNNDPADQREIPAYFRVDGGIERSFSDTELKEGGVTQYHVDLEDMDKLSPGLHEVEVFVDGEAVYTHRFYVERDWDEIMPEPTKEQMDKTESGSRSPYIVYYPDFDKTKGIKEYSVDLSIDKMDKGTYVSTACGSLDLNRLKESGVQPQTNYGDPGGIYTGIQCWEDGKTGFIMSVWDIIGTDAQGNKQVIKATPLYKDEKAVLKSHTKDSNGEGDFQQLLIEYPFDERHPYRTLLQLGTNEANGNTTLTMQVCDLISQEWKKIVTWDLGYSSDHIKTEELTGFLENYLTQYNGSVRSANLSNIRALDSASGEWVAAKSVKFTVNNSLDPMAYSGSYQFGADENSYYAITSGVEDLCKYPKSGTSFSVKNPSTEKPY